MATRAALFLSTVAAVLACGACTALLGVTDVPSATAPTEAGPEADQTAPPVVDGGGDAGGDGANDSGGDGASVSSDGASDAPFGDGACATVTIGTNQQPVYMLFVLDGSGSMSQSNKWIAVTGALTSIFNDMASKNDPGLGAGLIVFSDAKDVADGGGFGPYPSVNDVPIAQMSTAQATKLEGRYAGDSPNSSTPTGEALGVTGSEFGTSTGGYHELATFVPQSPLLPGGKKVLVLITDGVPTDNCAPTTPSADAGYNYPANPCIAYAATELASTPASGGPIETFVIGTGTFPSLDLSSFDPSFLGYLASVGGGAPAGCSPSDNSSTAGLCYFEVDPSGSATATETAFEDAINAIRGEIISCTFAFNGVDAGAIVPSEVNVTLNGVVLTENASNGWTFDNPSSPTAIVLHGPACNTALTSSATVDVVVGCPTQQ